MVDPDTVRQIGLEALRTYPGYLLDAVAGAFRDLDPGRATIVAGPPRSGTTWIFEQLLEVHRFKPAFEPFHGGWYPRAHRLGLGPRPYRAPDTDDPELAAYVDEVLAGRVAGRHAFYRLTGPEVAGYTAGSPTLMKTVRATRLLPWIERWIEPAAIVLVVRDPVETVGSQLANRTSGYYGIEGRVPDGRRIVRRAETLLDEERLSVVEAAGTPAERLACIWCLDCWVPLVRHGLDEALVVTYADLVEDPGARFASIFGAAGVDADVEDRTERLSRTASSDDVEDRTTRWRRRMDEGDVAAVERVVERFGLADLAEVAG